MKTIKLILTVFTLGILCPLSQAQNCQGDKVIVYKGAYRCGCHCKKKCVTTEELPLYLANGWNTYGCFTCCWVINDEKEETETSVTEIYPNVAPGSVTIAFNLPYESDVTIKVLDSAGRYVTTVADEYFEEQSNELIWDQRGLTPGMYFLQLESAGYRETKIVSIL